jgi:lipoteichoic acid synthase
MSFMSNFVRNATFKTWHFSPWIFCLAYCIFMAARSGHYLALVPFTVSTTMAFMIAYVLGGLTKSRIVHALTALILLVPILIQMQSLRLAGELLSVMAMANADSAKAISVKLGHVAPFVCVIFCILMTLFLPVRHSPKLPKSVAAGIFAVYCALVIQNVQSVALINHLELPVISFAATVIDAEFTEDGIFMADSERAKLEQHYRKEITYQPNSKYATLLETLPERPNIVVLFVESTSARLMSAYGGSRAGLMPNLDRFYEKSLVVDNYYNHTAATLRGLRGQLTSSFIGARENGEDGLGGVDDSEITDHTRRGTVISVPQILRSSGYETIFLTPHHEGMNINTILKDVGFDRVVTGTQVAAKLNVEHIPITDRNLYHFLPQMTAKLKEPYFVGVYNFGTHLLEDSPDEKFEDGKSPVLNRFHNADVQIGKFVDNFMSDPKNLNTILIITADHPSYPAPEFLEVEDVTPGEFIDRIPMMIYWKGVQHVKIDLKGRNSLSFAPTVMELARVQSARNYFLGCSIFADTCSDASFVTTIDEHIFDTFDGRVRYLTEMKSDEAYIKARNIIERFVGYSGF